MGSRYLARLINSALVITVASCCYCQERSRAAACNPQTLIEQGEAALAQNQFQEASELFQKALDLDPSSAKGNQQLGVALSREIMVGNVRPSADTDVFERAENHLQRAIELAPSSSTPILALSDLEAFMAERSIDATERSDRYGKAIQSLKRVLAIDPGKRDTYLRLANLERDQFGPALQRARAQIGKNGGPISDPALRHALQQQYGSLLEDAIANARRASETSASSQRPLLLMYRLLLERALIRDTAELYTSDIHSSEDWLRQFLAAGGHLDSRDAAFNR